VGFGGLVAQARNALRVEALDPLGNRLRRRVELPRSRGLNEAAIHDGADHLLSTFRGQTGILMRVHSVLRESLVFGDFSVHG
jgi:hypothetical protein